MFTDITILPILVSAILVVAVGSIWYSPLLFGTAWMKSIGLSMESGQISERDVIVRAIQSVLVYVVFFFVLAQFIVDDFVSDTSLVRTGTLLTALVVVHTLGSVILERRSMVYVLINAGYSAVVIFGGIGVIAFWPW